MRNGWIETTLGQVADVIDPHPSHRAPIVDELGIPFIGIGDLRNTGDVDFSKARKVSREILSEHKLRYSRSDYLIGLGRVASIGMVVKLPDDSIDYVVSPTLAVIKAKKILPQFLYISLQGNHLQEQFQKYKKGSTRESVGMQVLRKLSIQVPPLAEQKRIVDLISSMDDGISATERLISQTKQLRAGLLSDLLSGKHEIPASYDKVMGAA
jgi:type I restriction enzyme S subunit